MSKVSSGLFPNRLPTNKSQLKHMFGVRPGHLADTAKNREKISQIANDDTYYVDTDFRGNRWYVKPLRNGGQYWAEVNKSGIIWDGGYNRSPKPWNPGTGLKNPIKPAGRKTLKKPIVKPKKGGTK